MTRWMDFESLMLSKIRQKKKKKPYHFVHMWDIKQKANKKQKNP